MKKENILHILPKSIILYLLLTFILLFIPMECLGFSLLSWSKTKMQEEIDSSTKSSVHYLMDNFLVKINDFATQLTRFTNNNLFVRFAMNNEVLNSSDYYVSLLDQQNLIKYSPSLYSMIEDIVVYYPEIGSSLSATDSWIIDQKEEITGILSAIRNSKSVIAEYKNSLFLYSFYPANTQYSEATPMYFLSLELSQHAMVDFLDLYGQNHDTVLYFHPQGKSIYSSSVSDQDIYISYIRKLEELLGTNSKETTYSLSDSEYYVLAEYSPYLQCSILQFIPMAEIYKVPNQIQRFLFIYSLLSIPVICIFCFLIYRLIANPIYSLLKGYSCVEEGNYTTVLSDHVISSEFKTLIRGFNRMTAHLHYTIDQLFQNKLYTQKIELKQLQMQMNPHFLYNTYFILHRLIKNENVEQAAQLSSYLGNYFQYITRNARDMVPLQTEWNHAVNYLKIQEFRFSSRISFQYEQPPAQYTEFPVPRLILQPLLENALEHGLKEVSENGMICLGFSLHPDSLEILISDNGNSLSQEAIERLQELLCSPSSEDIEFTAMRNIHRRLQLVYGSGSGLKLTSNVPSGLLIHIFISINKQPADTEEKT